MPGKESRPIKLGRILNKYIIVEILFYGTITDGSRDNEILLW